MAEFSDSCSGGSAKAGVLLDSLPSSYAPFQSVTTRAIKFAETFPTTSGASTAMGTSAIRNGEAPGMSMPTSIPKLAEKLIECTKSC